MSRKIQIVLPDPQADQLAELAAGTGEPQSTLAGLFVRNEIAQAAKDGKVRQLRQTPVIVGANGNRARWLEPYGGDPAWRQEMWGAIVALYGRYPSAREPQRRLVDRRTTHGDSLRAGDLALRARRRWRRPTRGACFPNSAQRLRPHPPTRRRRRHKDMDTRSTTRYVGCVVTGSALCGALWSESDDANTSGEISFRCRVGYGSDSLHISNGPRSKEDGRG
jgi:hypothetical protein